MRSHLTGTLKEVPGSLYVFIFLGASAFLHLLFFLTPPLDSDSALVGLMALHIPKGEFPIFFYGGHYGGALEAYLTALVFYLLGPSRHTLPLTACLEYFLFCGIQYLWVKRFFSKEAAFFGLAWCSLGPPLLLYLSSVSFLEYMWLLLLGTLLLYLASRLLWTPPTKRLLSSFIMLGLAAGLFWWIQFQAIYFIIPIAVLAVLSLPHSFQKKGWAVLPGFFLLGSLPFWIYNARHHWVSLAEAGKYAASIPFGESISFLFCRGLSILLGFWNMTAPRDYLPFPPGPLLPYFSKGLLGITFLGFFVLILSRRKDFFPTYRRPGLNWPPLSLPLLFLLSFVLIYGLSGIAGEKADRHFIPLYAVTPLFLGLMVGRCLRWNKALGWSLALLLLASNLYGSFRLLPIADSAKWERFQFIQKETASLVHHLERENIRHLYHFNYWIGTQLTFEAKEKILFSNPLHEMYPPYIEAVHGSTKVGYLFTNQRESYFENTLKMMEVSFQVLEIGRLFLYYDFKKKGVIGEELGNRNWRGFSQIQPNGTFYAFDRNPATAWTTRVTQDTGQFFQLDLGKVHPRGITIRMGAGRPQEIPEGIDLLSSIDGFHWKILFSDRERFFVPLDWVKGKPAYIKGRETLFWDLPEEPVRFVQFIITKKSLHPSPWIIPEIRVYQK
jgi:hypothetical protein